MIPKASANTIRLPVNLQDRQPTARGQRPLHFHQRLGQSLAAIEIRTWPGYRVAAYRSIGRPGRRTATGESSAISDRGTNSPPLSSSIFGLKFDVEGTPPESEQTFTVVSITGSSPKPPVCEVRNILPGPDLLPVGEKYELSFQLTHPYSNPFDTREVDLMAEVTRPDGTQTTQARVFYHEPFAFDEQRFHADLEPAGTPDFRLRYTPTQAGLHRIAVRGHVGDRTIALPLPNLSGHSRPRLSRLSPTVNRRSLTPDLVAKGRRALPGRRERPIPLRQSLPRLLPIHSVGRRRRLTMYKRLFERYARLGHRYRRAVDVSVVARARMDSGRPWKSRSRVLTAPGEPGSLIGFLNGPKNTTSISFSSFTITGSLALGATLTGLEARGMRRTADHTIPPHDSSTTRKQSLAPRRMLDYLVARWGYSPQAY